MEGWEGKGEGREEGRGGVRRLMVEEGKRR